MSISPLWATARRCCAPQEPVPGLLVGQPYQYVDDFDLDGTIDIGSTTTLEGEPYAPVPIAATNFAATFRPSMTKASRLHSSTWANSDT